VGTVTAIHVSEGDTVKVGQVILTVTGADGQAEPQPIPEAKSAQDEVANSENSVSEPATEPEPTQPISPPAASGAEAKSDPVRVDIDLPDLGENVESGTIVGILVSVGDTITQDQPLLELETDKATIEMPSPVAGEVVAIHVQEGAKAKVGQSVFTVDTVASAAVAVAEPEETVVQEREEISTPMAAPATSQEVPDHESPVSASSASADMLLPEINEALLDPSDMVRPKALEKEDLPIRRDRTGVPAAPNARRIARELGVNIAAVKGSGPNGRITLDDVKRHANRLMQAMQAGVPVEQPGVGVGVNRPSLPDFSKWGSVDYQPMSNIRRATARQMEVAWSNIPHVTQFHKADITNLEQIRKQFGPKAEAAGGKLTVTAILLKVVVSALKEFPQFNASIDMEKEEVIYKKYYHIGVAVDTDRGLLVPVIRDVDKKNIIELSVELGEVAAKARDRKLSLADMQGGTFTITNLGGIGGTNFTPIVNSPEVAILGVARGAMEPVLDRQTGQFEPRMMLPVALSYDHRIIDGADGARFANWVVQYLEQPFLTALQGW
jgi:pyruvate dehydrogenase E2 component (dihydrolipoamide acetyltransferase)